MTTSKAQGTAPTQETYLKRKNSIYLWSFIGANLAIFLSLIVSKGFAASSVDRFWERVTAKDGMIAAIIPISAIVLSRVLGDLGTARLVFWRWHNPLPGSRAFTELINIDPRIDVTALRKKLGELPQDPGAQNALWYRLYRGLGADIKISEAHRIYLLTRDMTVISSLFVLLFSIGVVGASVNSKTAALYAAVLIAQYLVVASAARNYGKRFVLNVLAEESQPV